jgi:NitT/TauT family transport system permease protein
MSYVQLDERESERTPFTGIRPERRTAVPMLLGQCGIFVLLLAAWEFAPLSDPIRYWFSSPSAIAVRIVQWVIDGSLWGHAAATLVAMFLGYVLGCVLGVLAGLVFGLFPKLHQVFSPYISALYALPKIALIPLLVILIGAGITSKVLLVAFAVFFLMLSNTVNGVRDIDPDLTRSLYLLGATRLEIVRKANIPAALPWIFTGMRLSVRYAFTNTLLAELIASNRGLGYLIAFYSGTFDPTGSYAAIFVVILFSLAVSEFVNLTERRHKESLQ